MDIVLYNKQHVEFLDEFGVLTSTMLMRKFKVTSLPTQEILKQLCNDFLNVYARTKDQICIEGREPISWIHRIKKKKMKPKKPPRWKDVTKP